MIFPQTPVCKPPLKFIKLAPFFAISTVLHVAVIFYHAPLAPRIHEELIPVTVMEMDRLGGGSDAGAGIKGTVISKGFSRMGVKKNAPVNFFRRGTTRVARVGHQRGSIGLQEGRDAGQPVAAPISEPQMPAPPENPSAPDSLIGAHSLFASPRGAEGLNSAGNGLGSGQASGGLGQYGSGSGSGVGGRRGFSPSALRFTQARYRETPKPPYPENARREGQEGRVLLRVLVDQEGKSKFVEVSGSSGSQLLDHAAAETIKRWRFLPARYGDKPVESWVRIPVDFRLTATQD